MYIRTTPGLAPRTAEGEGKDDTLSRTFPAPDPPMRAVSCPGTAAPLMPLSSSRRAFLPLSSFFCLPGMGTKYCSFRYTCTPRCIMEWWLLLGNSHLTQAIGRLVGSLAAQMAPRQSAGMPRPNMQASYI